MIIDDQPYLRSLIAKELSEEGHSICCFEDAASAMCSIPTEKPDIVLLDLYFEGFENWESLHRIKIKHPNLPVIIVTAYKNFLNDPRVFEADGYAIKESGAVSLRNKIKELLACKGH